MLDVESSCFWTNKWQNEGRSDKVNNSSLINASRQKGEQTILKAALNIFASWVVRWNSSKKLPGHDGTQMSRRSFFVHIVIVNRKIITGIVEIKEMSIEAKGKSGIKTYERADDRVLLITAIVQLDASVAVSSNQWQGFSCRTFSCVTGTTLLRGWVMAWLMAVKSRRFSVRRLLSSSTTKTFPSLLNSSFFIGLWRIRNVAVLHRIIGLFLLICSRFLKFVNHFLYSLNGKTFPEEKSCPIAGSDTSPWFSRKLRVPTADFLLFILFDVVASGSRRTEESDCWEQSLPSWVDVDKLSDSGDDGKELRSLVNLRVVLFPIWQD